MAANVGRVARKMFGNAEKGVGRMEKRVVERADIRAAFGADNFRETSRNPLKEAFRGNGFTEEEISLGINRSSSAEGWGSLSGVGRKASVNNEIMRNRAQTGLREAIPEKGVLPGDYVDGLKASRTIDDDTYDILTAKAENGASADDLYSNLIDRRTASENSDHIRRQAAARQSQRAEVAGDMNGGGPAPTRNTSDVMAERSFKGAKSQSDWTATRAHNETVGINNDMQRVLDVHKAGKMDDGLAKKLGFEGMNDPNLSEQGIRDSFNGRINKVKHETTTRDKLGYHKVPQTAAAVGGTAWLVSNMSQSKGQMSNSQLYGQSPQYGG